MKRPFTKEDTYNYNNCMAYTQADLDQAIAKAVRERTREIEEMMGLWKAMRAEIRRCYPECFEEDTP